MGTESRIAVSSRPSPGEPFEVSHLEGLRSFAALTLPSPTLGEVFVPAGDLAKLIPTVDFLNIKLGEALFMKEKIEVILPQIMLWCTVLGRYSNDRERTAIQDPKILLIVDQYSELEKLLPILRHAGGRLWNVYRALTDPCSMDVAKTSAYFLRVFSGTLVEELSAIADARSFFEGVIRAQN